MESILKDLKLESLIPKFVAERIEPENVSELSDDELVRLGVTTIGDRHRLGALCANTEKKTSVYSAIYGCRCSWRKRGSSRRGGRGGKRKVSSKRVGQ